VKNNNTGNIGICVIGNFEVEKPTGEQLAALKKAIIHISNLFPSVARGLPKNIFGHRHFMATDCPGANLIDFVNGLKYGSITLFDPEDEKK
jgi:hypothetical protein